MVLNVIPDSEPPIKAQRWVESIVGQSIISIDVLVGSTSAAVYCLKVESGDEYVLRLFTATSWLETEPDLATHEAAVLQVVSAASPVTPQLIGFDETGENTGFPAILMTKLPGSVELEPADINNWVKHLAYSLNEIHSMKLESDFAWHYKHWYKHENMKVPTWSNNPTAVQKLIDLLKQPAPELPAVFLHRDYHPTNLLWADETISGIVDWVNGCVGPAMVDVSHCRLNLAGLYGVDVADKFLEEWLKLAGVENYSLWWDVNGLANGNVFEGPLSVYRGWADFGKTDVTIDLLTARINQFVDSLAAQIA